MSGEKPVLGLGLIGTGFMGQTHSFGFGIAERAFDLPFRIERRLLADVSLEAADRANAFFGFARTTDDWREVIEDPDIHLVDITTPNRLHHEMALAALAAGKHVYCEKPLAPTVAEAEEMVAAAQKAGVTTQVGFNYLKNPLFSLAKRLIDDGEIGRVYSVRAIHAEDYMADPKTGWSWRLDPAGGGGAFADLGSHIVAAVRYLFGPIVEVTGACETVIAERPLPGEGGAPFGTAADKAGGGAREAMRPVEVEDIGRAFVRFANGVTGSLEANWVASGRKMQQEFEIYGETGAIVFSLERMSEIRLFRTEGPTATRGFRTIYAGPDHAPYGAFCIAQGHQLGFNDIKAIEVHGLIEAIAAGRPSSPDFAEAAAVHKVVEAVYRSSRERRPVTID